MERNAKPFEELTLDEAIEVLQAQRAKGADYVRCIVAVYDNKGEIITNLLMSEELGPM